MKAMNDRERLLQLIDLFDNDVAGMRLEGTQKQQYLDRYFVGEIKQIFKEHCGCISIQITVDRDNPNQSIHIIGSWIRFCSKHLSLQNRISHVKILAEMSRD